MKVVRCKEMANLTGLHGNTVRRWCDEGLIPYKRDFRGWRWFPEPDKTVERVRKLLNGEITADNTTRICAAENCENTFAVYPNARKKKYCSRRCAAHELWRTRRGG